MLSNCWQFPERFFRYSDHVFALRGVYRIAQTFPLPFSGDDFQNSVTVEVGKVAKFVQARGLLVIIRSKELDQWRSLDLA